MNGSVHLNLILKFLKSISWSLHELGNAGLSYILKQLNEQKIEEGQEPLISEFYKTFIKVYCIQFFNDLTRLQIYATTEIPNEELKDLPDGVKISIKDDMIADMGKDAYKKLIIAIEAYKTKLQNYLGINLVHPFLFTIRNKEKLDYDLGGTPIITLLGRGRYKDLRYYTKRNHVYDIYKVGIEVLQETKERPIMIIKK